MGRPTWKKVVREVAFEGTRSLNTVDSCIPIRWFGNRLKPRNSKADYLLIWNSLVSDQPDYLLCPCGATFGVGDHPNIIWVQLNILQLVYLFLCDKLRNLKPVIKDMKVEEFAPLDMAFTMFLHYLLSCMCVCITTLCQHFQGTFIS